MNGMIQDRSDASPTRTFCKLRSRAFTTLLPLLPMIVVAGCAIHPVQQDVTGVRPVDIIHHIRCETRLAIQDKAIEMLRDYGKGGHQSSINLADQLEAKRGRHLMNFDPSRLATQRERDFYYRYIQTGIAYDFTLDITEDNKATIFADPVRLITNGIAGIGLDATADFSRNNARRFIMSDTFGKVLADEKLECLSDLSPNFVYPIAGRIGIRELISTFVDLNEDKNLQALESGNSRVFADTMTFVTTLTGSVNPHVEIAPLGSRWGLAGPANLHASGQRLDSHKVIVGLSMEAPKGVSTLVPVAALAITKSALQKSANVTATEQSALDAARQARYDAYLDRASR